MFAVVMIGSKQYKVETGDIITVPKLSGTLAATVTFDHVLLTSSSGKTKIGTPTIPGAKVTAKILSQEKGEKIGVRRFKAKVRERRHVGFRPKLTKLEILSIGAA